MQTVQSWDDHAAFRDSTGRAVAESMAQGSEDGAPRWIRIARAVGRAWMEASLLSDPFAYNFYLSAQADAES